MSCQAAATPVCLTQQHDSLKQQSAFKLSYIFSKYKDVLAFAFNHHILQCCVSFLYEAELLVSLQCNLGPGTSCRNISHAWHCLGILLEELEEVSGEMEVFV